MGEVRELTHFNTLEAGVRGGGEEDGLLLPFHVNDICKLSTSCGETSCFPLNPAAVGGRGSPG